MLVTQVRWEHITINRIRPELYVCVCHQVIYVFAFVCLCFRMVTEWNCSEGGLLVFRAVLSRRKMGAICSVHQCFLPPS